MAQPTPTNPTANPLFSYAINESIKNNIQSSIFLLFLQHCSASWNGITWFLPQSKRTIEGNLQQISWKIQLFFSTFQNLNKVLGHFSHLVTSLSSHSSHYHTIIADYIPSEQTEVRIHTPCFSLSSTPSLFVSFLSTRPLFKFFDCNIFFFLF